MFVNLNLFLLLCLITFRIVDSLNLINEDPFNIKLFRNKHFLILVYFLKLLCDNVIMISLGLFLFGNFFIPIVWIRINLKECNMLILNIKLFQDILSTWFQILLEFIGNGNQFKAIYSIQKIACNNLNWSFKLRILFLLFDLGKIIWFEGV